MAYYQFDLKFVNLGALPAGAGEIYASALFSDGDASVIGEVGIVPASGDLTITIDTSAPSFGSAFELASTDKVWFSIEVSTEYTGPGTLEYLSSYTIGPYTVGAVGVEVPAP